MIGRNLIKGEKTKTAGFVAYRKQGDEFYVYLQKRTKNAPHNPGKLAFFGGAIRPHETREQALVREVQEELSIVPQRYQLLGEFEEEVSVVSLFYAEAHEDFESAVVVREGDYGTFVSERNIQGNPEILEVHQQILSVLIAALRTSCL